ncbi:LVIVD repeat-containing protein [Spirosoma sp.]|uniref:LVIVD repeat-containing protein n=1 Tax=Spirosoma sp. TaxID=1899569 RepID=UPI003B3B04BF
MKSLLYSLLIAALLVACNKGSDSVSPGAGVGGSTARFTISGNNLYTVSNTALQTYDIATSGNPKKGVQIPLGFGIETIFPYRNNLFIGTQTGMFIYDITQPNNPRQLSLYTHIQSCDPVVAQGNYAYVTLRSGTTCRNTAVNSLDVVDISNLSSPKLLRSYPMKNPHGLGVDGTFLFVGEGDYGLRVMDISDPTNVREVQYFDSTRTYDVIPLQKRLIVTGPDGIYQYSYADLKQLKLLSKIPVQP